MRHEDVPSLCDPQSDGSWKCKKCQSDIMAAEVKRSVWNFPEACAGSGEVVTDFVPYCPKCEEKPSNRGPPITPR